MVGCSDTARSSAWKYSADCLPDAPAKDALPATTNPDTMTKTSASKPESHVRTPRLADGSECAADVVAGRTSARPNTIAGTPPHCTDRGRTSMPMNLSLIHI